MTEVQVQTQVSGIGRTVTRAEVEDFLYHEADLLDRWRLDDWFVKSGVGVSVYRRSGEAGA